METSAAAPRARLKEGTAIDATMPMMVTTSRSSISVNPASERRSLRCAVCMFSLSPLPG